MKKKRKLQEGSAAEIRITTYPPSRVSRVTRDPSSWNLPSENNSSSERVEDDLE